MVFGRIHKKELPRLRGEKETREVEGAAAGGLTGLHRSPPVMVTSLPLQGSPGIRGALEGGDGLARSSGASIALLLLPSGEGGGGVEGGVSETGLIKRGGNGADGEDNGDAEGGVGATHTQRGQGKRADPPATNGIADRVLAAVAPSVQAAPRPCD